uniref:Uncharacterized protein n=1 Tax=Eutreptiella gymnastica TaxID=73025 RepID=A0A7S4LGJ3_9EUGL
MGAASSGNRTMWKFPDKPAQPRGWGGQSLSFSRPPSGTQTPNTGGVCQWQGHTHTAHVMPHGPLLPFQAPIHRRVGGPPLPEHTERGKAGLEQGGVQGHAPVRQTPGGGCRWSAATDILSRRPAIHRCDCTEVRGAVGNEG